MKEYQYYVWVKTEPENKVLFGFDEKMLPMEIKDHACTHGYFNFIDYTKLKVRRKY